jgi:hypothetical protein
MTIELPLLLILDRFRAILQSFCELGRTIKKVTIYYSDFGLEMMQKEEQFGPTGLWKKAKLNQVKREKSSNSNDENYDDDDNDDDDDEEEEDDDESLDGIEGVEYGEDGDFRRTNNSVGIILHSSLLAKGKARPEKISEGIVMVVN